MIVLGIDPGTATIGYGVLKTSGPRKGQTRCLAYGLIETTPDHLFPQRLEKISRDLDDLIEKYRPELIAIESVFFFRNQKTLIPVSRASGVIILGAAKRKVPVIEFTPIQVKARVANYGRAEKEEVQRRIVEILGLKSVPRPDDVADALGVALCGVFSLTQKAISPKRRGKKS
ncbi:MAG: crossover junction endodeoxyribonuclease RuvC [Candidatus Nealsonbacteria bacterium]|nr:crossover junction endodeoxyribonuclease RuvC [Candidatus Nealsonbacteria bacterium]